MKKEDKTWEDRFDQFMADNEIITGCPDEDELIKSFIRQNFIPKDKVSEGNNWEKDIRSLEKYHQVGHQLNCDYLNGGECSCGWEDYQKDLIEYIYQNFLPKNKVKELMEGIDFYGWDEKTQRMIRDKLIKKIN